ncbi:hypothetical protein PanWU01x14_208460, partial [Parasponia andersonii]
MVIQISVRHVLINKVPQAFPLLIIVAVIDYATPSKRHEVPVLQVADNLNLIAKLRIPLKIRLYNPLNCDQTPIGQHPFVNQTKPTSPYKILLRKVVSRLLKLLNLKPNRTRIRPHPRPRPGLLQIKPAFQTYPHSPAPPPAPPPPPVVPKIQTQQTRHNKNSYPSPGQPENKGRPVR